MFHRVRFAGYLILVSIGVLVTGSRAAAELDYREGGYQIPEFVRADLTLITQELELDRDQQSILEALYLDYEHAFREKVAELGGSYQDSSVRQLREDADAQAKVLFEEMSRRLIGAPTKEARQKIHRDFWSRIGELRRDLPPKGPDQARQPALTPERIKLLDEFAEERDRLRNEFLGDLQTILLDWQREQWPDLERFLRRHKLLRQGVLSAESLDLIRMVERLDLPVEAAERLESILAEYAARIDAVLQARTEFLVKPPESKPNARITWRRRVVRDVNLEFAEAIARELPPEFAGQFSQEVNERAFPSIYQPSPGLELLRVASEISTIDDTLRASLLELAVEHRQRLADMNEVLRATVLQYEANRLQFNLDAKDRNAAAGSSEKPAGRAGGQQKGAQQKGAQQKGAQQKGAQRPAGKPGPKPKAPPRNHGAIMIRDAFQERNQLEVEVVERIRGMLTPEQLAGLPVPRAN